MGRVKIPKVKAPPEWGIEPVPVEKRILGFMDYFALWSSLGVGLLVILAGAQLVPALTLRGAVAAIILGTLIGNIPLALVGYMGGRHGIPTMVLARSSFGIRGSYLPTLLNIAQLVGWAIFEVAIMASAANTISSTVLGYSNYPLWAAIFASICTLMAVGGPLAIVRKWIEKFAIWIVYSTAAWLLYRILAVQGLAGLSSSPASGGLSFLLAVDLVIAMPISWMPLVADYNRFAGGAGRAFHGTYWGYFLANVLFYGLGALFILATGEADIVKAIAMVAFGIPALLLILVDETDNGFADIYSAAVSIQNIAPKVPQRVSAPILGAAAFLASLVLPIERYEWFLLWIGAVFIPLFGVVMADYFAVKRGGLSVEELYKPRGKYWYYKGVNPPAVLAWILGFFFYYSILYFKPELGASIPTLIFTAAIYWILMEATPTRREGGYGEGH
ncbi:MAG: putative hydroxymethylpyrimidine transporter CytX [Candidatus Bathyarchaeia archaeon]|nr:putative hydroxymethylpyrimidine transporter CytX [Candidatus Bathyarchaeota archaeon]